jgi:hypothetical protein
MYIGVDVKYPLLLSDFNEALILLVRFSNKYSKYYIKKNKNPFSRSRVVPSGGSDGQTDVQTTKLPVSHFSQFANAPSNRP